MTMDTLQILDAFVAGDLEPGTAHDLAPGLSLHILDANHVSIIHNGKQVAELWNSSIMPSVIPQELFNKF